MRYYLDTEFIEDGREIDLLSIGIVRDDGAELYLCNAEADLARANSWVRANVFPHLPWAEGRTHWVQRYEIVMAIRHFAPHTDKDVEFWAYYADYDWVALCQLFGRMVDLPPHFPRYCMDLKQLSVSLGSPKHPSKPKDEHSAIADARWNRELHRCLMEHQQGMPR